MLKMVFVLVVICGFSGFVLSATNNATREQRANQLMKFVQGPSITSVFANYEFDNEPITDRFVIKMGEDKDGKPIEKIVFPAKKGGSVIAVAYASSGSGYGGMIDVMVGIDMEGKLTGISVMTHSETPGLGARVTETEFSDQFRGLSLEEEVSLGGNVDGISGATFSSKGVVAAINEAVKIFPKVKEEVS